MIKRPEDVWPVDSEYEAAYGHAVAHGRDISLSADACMVSIARNAMPDLVNTLALVDEVREGFKSLRYYVYENDSTDQTAEVLDSFAATRPWVTVEHDALGGIDSRGFEPERTERLAGCRNRCLEWVRREAGDTAYTIVLDVDPQHGFSVDGIHNSVYWLSENMPLGLGGMASYSLYRVANDDGKTAGVAHYDAWAARPVCWWRDRRDEVGFTWFSSFLPPVGATPCPMNSAFGGLGVYRTKAFLAGGYSGEDCEHVPHHRRMADAGWSMFLNPGSRYISIWR